MREKSRCVVIGVFVGWVIIFSFTSFSYAVPVFYTDRAAFEAVIGPHNTITFEEFPAGKLCTPAFPYIPDPCHFTTQGVTFTTTVGDEGMDQRPLLTIDAGFGLSLSRGILSNQIAKGPDEFFFDFSSDFIGFDVVSGGSSPVTTIEITDKDGTKFTTNVMPVTGGGTFWGATSTVGFSRVSLYDPPPASSNFLIDNIAVATPIPEPSSLLLMGSGLLVMGLYVWRRERFKQV